MHGVDFSTPDSSVPFLRLQESLPSPTLLFPSEVILLEVRPDFYLWQHLLIFLGCYFLSLQVYLSLSLPLPQWSSGTTVTSNLLGWLPWTLLTNPVSSLACLHGLNSPSQLTITLRPFEPLNSLPDSFFVVFIWTNSQLWFYTTFAILYMHPYSWIRSEQIPHIELF